MRKDTAEDLLRKRLLSQVADFFDRNNFRRSAEFDELVARTLVSELKNQVKIEESHIQGVLNLKPS